MEKRIFMPLVKIKNIVRNLEGDIPFLQPMYEAIVNALEAKATDISIVLREEKNTLLDDDKNYEKKIVGFDITDNGDGFTSENRKSFCEYLSDHKIKLGCKSVGRYTWLKVFKRVKIESFTKNEHVVINFSKDFDENEIRNVKEHKSSSSKTTISFFDVSREYDKKGFLADVNKVKESVEEHLLAKLYLLSKNGRKYQIKFHLNSDECEITNEDVLNLECKEFEVEDELEESRNKHKFCLHYNFTKNARSKQMWYCAHERAVSKFTDEVARFKNLPDGHGMLCLLTSEYLDERVNNERNSFFLKNEATIDSPISFCKINDCLRREIEEIVFNKYPNIKQANDKIIAECIEKNPHLAKHIENDQSIIKNKEDLVSNAMDGYLEEKKEVRNKFEELLSKHDLDSDEFYKTISQISDISARELAQYLVYRQQIIDALGNLNSEDNKKEKLLHNLFMKMGETSDINKEKCVHDSNIWLLDDKYMSYTQMFSDKQIKKIKEAIAEENAVDSGEKYEPDLAIFYSEINKKDVVVVEFKGIGTNPNAKGIAFTEISRNLGVICRSIEDINTMYGYIITKLDNDFRKLIESQPGVKKMFSANEEPVYYIYNDNLLDKNNNKKDGHIYILDTVILHSDAAARNKVFLDVIKRRTN